MINYYLVEIKGKDIKKLLYKIFNLRVNIYNIKYENDRVLFKVSYDDYLKIKNIKTICIVRIVKICGRRKFIEVIKKYQISLVTLVISVFFVIFLSKLLLFINIDSDNKEIRNLITEELKENGITLFTINKSYNELKKISNKIKTNNLDKIEWIEFEKKGITLNVKVIERVFDKIQLDSDNKDVIASKNGYIKKIYSSRGEILKNIDDYVRKGEVIISGNIFRNDKVVDKVHAKGKVYAEVWYIVKTNQSYKYWKDIVSDKGYFKIVVKILDKEYCLFKIKKNIEFNDSKNVFNNKLFSILIKKEKIHNKIYYKYNDKELGRLLSVRARKSVSDTLKDDEYITFQKTLKKYKYNGKMYVEIFLKTYEDIAVEKDIQEIEEKN